MASHQRSTNGSTVLRSGVFDLIETHDKMSKMLHIGNIFKNNCRNCIQFSGLFTVSKLYQQKEEAGQHGREAEDPGKCFALKIQNTLNPRSCFCARLFSGILLIRVPIII